MIQIHEREREEMIEKERVGDRGRGRGGEMERGREGEREREGGGRRGKERRQQHVPSLSLPLHYILDWVEAPGTVWPVMTD